MKKTILLIFVIVISVSGISQTTKLKLQDYKLTDLKRHQLDFNFFIGGNNQFRKVVQNSVEDKTKSNGYGHRIEIFHSYYRNTRKYQGLQSGGLLSSISRYRSSEGPKQNSTVWNVNYSSENRFYAKNLWFLETSPNVSFNSDLWEGSNDFEYEDFEQRIVAEIPLGVGYGRIERVEDYRMAIYLQETLSRNGQLPVELDKNKLLELAAEISRLKNRRFYDVRLQHIYEIEALDSMFTSFGMSPAKSASFYANLLDYWRYANNPIRENGWRISVFANARLDSYKRRYESADTLLADVNYSSNLGRFIPEFRIYYAIPFQLNWQLTTGLNVNYNATISGDSQEFDKVSYSLFAKIGYYPNSRSFMEFDLRNDFSQRLSIAANTGNLGSSLQGSLNLYHYFSPQLRLRVYYNFDFNRNDVFFKNQRFFQDYGVNFTYMIF